MLIPGENAMVFMPHGYGFSVFIGHVSVELPHGWILDPARTVEMVNPSDSNDARWVELAEGKDKSLRKNAQYGTLIEGGVRVPLGCLSLVWHGELPK